MTINLEVDGRTFVFGEGWRASKYDEWQFYRNNYLHLQAKAVDIVAISPARTLHLIEVKDYTHPETDSVPLEDLPKIIAHKCRDTLGGLVAAKFLAHGGEREDAKAALTSQEMRVTFHIELPFKRRRLQPQDSLIANLRSKLRTEIKSIDPHARVTRHADSVDEWTTHLTPG